jgi:hypothetical protein
MSTLAQQIPALTTTVERRFYSRIVPQSPIFVAFKESKDCLLLNVSENGLLVSTPAELTCNFVARISIPLKGLPRPVQVDVRVVWVSETSKLAGIQLLDLSEHDRQLIRKWGAQESAQFLQPEPRHILAVAGTSAPPSEASQPTLPSTEEAPFNGPQEIASLAPPLTIRRRSISAAAGIATYSALIATVSVAAVFFARNGAQAHYFARSLESAYESSAAGPPAQDIPASLPNPDTLKPAADSQVASLAASAGAAQSQSAPTGTPALQNSAQTGENTKDGVNRGGSATSTPQNQRHASRISSTSPAEPTSRTDPTPDTSRLLAENPANARNDQSQPAAIPPATDSAPVSSTPSESFTSSNDATPVVQPTSPDPPAATEPIRNPTPASDLAAGVPTTIPSTSAAAPVHSAPPRNSDAPVIQMDAPARQVLEIHLPSGYYAPFFNLPGERVLETPSATMHIQRSVHLPATHVRWPSNHNKKVVIGGLLSRVDPRAAQVQLIPGDSVRVRASVAKDGRVDSVTPLSGPPYLVRAVVQAVHQWRYQPTLLDGKPVETQCFVVVQFHAPATHTARK